jgi:hypothetical protein
MQEVSAFYVAASLTSDVAAMIQPFKNIRLSPLKFGFCEVVLKSLKHYRQDKKARPSFVNAFNYFDRFRCSKRILQSLTKFYLESLFELTLHEVLLRCPFIHMILVVAPLSGNQHLSLA